jgi:D-glycero-D-manno-heptose 1,7-bisphosphate phosphatase
MNKKFLLLDRDGVINVERKNYVLNWAEFRFKNDFISNAARLAEMFKYILIVTNQRCVGKGLITLLDLDEIHDKMIADIELVGGRVNKVYSATGLSDLDFMRKPNTGMMDQIKKDFPDFLPELAIMVGNRQSDMRFAKRCGICAVHYTENNTEEKISSNLWDFSITDWFNFNYKILNK